MASSILNSNDEKDYRYFVAIPESEYVKLTATGTDGRVYTYEKGDNIYVKAVDYVLQNGYYYPIAVRMHGQPMLGDPYYSDGTWATCNKHADGAKAVGIVVYLGSGAIVENYPHGLVMALKDASQSAYWATATGTVSNDRAQAAADVLVNFGGLGKTQDMDNETKYPAAYAAYHYNVTVDKNKCSGWFLPSSGQWISVVYGLCGAEYPVKGAGPGNDTWWLNGNNNKKEYWGTNATDIAKVLYPSEANGYAHTIINRYLSAASQEHDDIITVIGESTWISYWTSTEAANADAIRMNFGVEKKNENRYSSIKADKKSKTKTQLRVRAFLAF